MPWMIVIVAIALWVGISKGVPALARTWGKRRQERREMKAFVSQQRTKKKQLIAEAIKNGEAPAAAKAAAEAAIKAGEGLGVSVTTLGAVWGAFKDAFRSGWQQGRAQGAALRDRKKPQDDTMPVDHELVDDATPIEPDAPDAPDAGERQAVTEPPLTVERLVREVVEDLMARDLCIQQISEGPRLGETPGVGVYIEPPRYCGKEVAPDSYYCPEHQPGGQRGDVEPPATPATNTTGGTMTIETATGGEVYTYTQLLTELDAIKAEALAESEDAAAAERLAAERLAHVETMVASLSTLRVDPATKDSVAALHEAFKGRQDLAKQRAGAADHELTLASAARETAQRNHGLIKDAVTSSSAPAADGAFYND